MIESDRGKYLLGTTEKWQHYTIEQYNQRIVRSKSHKKGAPLNSFAQQRALFIILQLLPICRVPFPRTEKQ